MTNPQRDYRRFLRDDGGLDVKLLPRDVYINLVTAYRSREDAIAEVFSAYYLEWDLEQALAAQQATGAEPDVAAAAQSVLDGLDDSDWWRVTAAFEMALIRDFIELAPEWADLLDPVYDFQERRGWRKLQP